MTGSVRTRIARWLSPELAAKESQAHFVHHRLEEARWWLAHEFPEVASFADYMLDREAWFATTTRTEPNPWTPPPWVHDISGLREWLREGRKKLSDGAQASTKANSGMNK